MQTTHTMYVQALLGAALVADQQYSPAEPRLLEGYRGMQARADKMPADNKFLLRAVDGLVALYTTLEKPADVTKWQTARDNLLSAQP